MTFGIIHPNWNARHVMFFNIDSDNGQSISGWFAPDNPSITPRLAILIPGQNEIQLQTNVSRPDVRELGLHSTGMVGFTIDHTIIPGLDAIDDIEIVDAETRLPIYRRFQAAQHLERKLFLFDCAVMPQRKIAQKTTQRFALNYLNCERYSLETMIVLINNHFSKSIFFSGRSNFNRYAGFLENQGYVRAALLRDPFEELAERLLFIDMLVKSNVVHLIPTYATGLTSLVDFVRDLPLNDSKALLSSFRQASDQQRQAMMSPMVRMLGCNVDELPTHNDVSLALDHLASLDVVGARSHYHVFATMLDRILDASVFGDGEPATSSLIQNLATSLSRIGVATDLLEHDIALYAYTQEAVMAGLQKQDELIERGN